MSDEIIMKKDLENIALLAVIVKEFPGIWDANLRKNYSLRIIECYDFLRDRVPRAYSNEFLIRCACGEFGTETYKT